MQDFAGAFQDGLGETGQSRHLDAVALVSGALDDFAEEDDVVVPFAHRDIAIGHAGAGAGEVGEFVVMRGEKRAAAGDVVEMFGHAPRDGESIEGGRAAADFVKDDEAAIGGVVEDGGGFVHLDHEGGLSAREVVARADAGEDAVDEADLGGGGGDEAAGLGEKDEQGDLADVGAFAGHVGSGEDDEAGLFGVERGVVGNEASGGHCLVKDGMASVGDPDRSSGGEFRADVAKGAGGFGQSAEGVDLRDGAGGVLQGFEFGQDGGAELRKDFRFEGARAFFAAEDAAFHVFQFRRDEAFRVGRSLFAGVIGGDGGEVRLGDFEVVAEDRVVADFERLDAGAGDFAVLQFSDPLTSFGAGATEFVEVGVVAFADHATVARGRRGFVDEGGGEEFDQWIEGAEVRGEGEEGRRVVFGQGRAERGKEGE